MTVEITQVSVEKAVSDPTGQPSSAPTWEYTRMPYHAGPPTVQPTSLPLGEHVDDETETELASDKDDKVDLEKERSLLADIKARACKIHIKTHKELCKLLMKETLLRLANVFVRGEHWPIEMSMSLRKVRNSPIFSLGGWSKTGVIADIINRLDLRRNETLQGSKAYNTYYRSRIQVMWAKVVLLNTDQVNVDLKPDPFRPWQKRFSIHFVKGAKAYIDVSDTLERWKAEEPESIETVLGHLFDLCNQVCMEMVGGAELAAAIEESNHSSPPRQTASIKSDDALRPECVSSSSPAHTGKGHQDVGAAVIGSGPQKVNDGARSTSNDTNNISVSNSPDISNIAGSSGSVFGNGVNMLDLAREKTAVVDIVNDYFPQLRFKRCTAGYEVAARRQAPLCTSSSDMNTLSGKVVRNNVANVGDSDSGVDSYISAMGRDKSVVEATMPARSRSWCNGDGTNVVGEEGGGRPAKKQAVGGESTDLYALTRYSIHDATTETALLALTTGAQAIDKALPLPEVEEAGAVAPSPCPSAAAASGSANNGIAAVRCSWER